MAIRNLADSQRWSLHLLKSYPQPWKPWEIVLALPWYDLHTAAMPFMTSAYLKSSEHVIFFNERPLFHPLQDYQCEKCGSTPKTNQNLASKGKWVVDNGTYCRPCFVTDKLEKEKFEKERAFYARAKTDLYPRSITNPSLKRIASNESWTSSASFKQSWRPASTIQHLVQALMHHKKSTEDVTSPRDIADFPQDEAGPSSSSSDEMCCNDNGEAVHLQALEADLDVGYVSEEDLQICDSHASADGMVEMSSGVPAGHDSFSEDDVVNDQRTNSKKENEVPEGGKKGGQALDVPQRLSSWPVLGGSRVMDSHVDG